MKGKRFKEQQIIRILQKAESGLTHTNESPEYPGRFSMVFDGRKHSIRFGKQLRG